MAAFNNPASRLLALLSNGQELSKTQACKDAWYELLNVPNGNEPLLLRRLSKTMELTEKVESSVKKVEGIENKAPYLKWKKDVVAAFARQNLSGIWDSFKQNIDDHTISYLSMTADMLSREMPEDVIQNDKLEEVTEQIKQLMSEINTTELPPDLKFEIIKNLQKILYAIEEYRISGLEAISEIIESIWGKALLDQHFTAETQKTEIGKKFWSVVARITMLATLAVAGQQLAPTVAALIPTLTEDSIVTGQIIENEVELKTPTTEA